MHTKKPQGNDIGHCFIAIDPALSRGREDFTADVTRFCDDLRATKPVDPAHPVMVAGDPQEQRGKTDAGRDTGRPRPPEPGAADRSSLRGAVAVGLSRTGQSYCGRVRSGNADSGTITPALAELVAIQPIGRGTTSAVIRAPSPVPPWNREGLCGDDARTLV